MAESKCNDTPVYPSHMPCSYAALIAAVQGACANPNITTPEKAAKYAHEVAIRVIGLVDKTPNQEIEDALKSIKKVCG